MDNKKIIVTVNGEKFEIEDKVTLLELSKHFEKNYKYVYNKKECV